MAKKEEKDDQDEKVEEITVVTDRAEDLDTPAINGSEFGDVDGDDDGPKDLKSKSKDKKEAKEDDDDEDDDQEEQRLGESEDDEDETKEKRTHKTRRQRRKEAELRLRRERDFLEKRNDQLERQIQVLAHNQGELDKRLGDNEESTLDERISRKKSLIAKADSVIADAITNSKGAELVEANRIRDQLKDELADLEEAKKARAKAREEVGDDGDRAPPPDPRIVAHATKWHKENKWFDFRRRDYDSKIAGAIDDSLIAEGYDPADEDYWEELSKRVAKALPERASKKKKNGKREEPEDEDDADLGEDEESDEEETPKPKKKQGGPKFRSGGAGRDLKPNEVHLSRERIAALKELGVWDDAKLRNKYLKRYRDYDRSHSGDQE